MERVFVCGTRAVVRRTVGDYPCKKYLEQFRNWDYRDYRVVCATCGGGGTVRHDNKTKANSAAVRDSGRPCRKCGAS